MARLPSRPTGFVLVADDFGLTGPVSRAILTLGEAGRLSGAGAMTGLPAFAPHARAFADLAGTMDLGLHVTLTLGAPLGPMPILAPTGVLPSFRDLARRALAGRVPGREVEDEIARQLEAFTAATGRLPDYLDGHQHVHVLPGVRGALFRAVEKIWPAGSPRPWVRDPFETPGAILARGVATAKAGVIAGLSVGFGRSLAGRGLPANRGFAGVSPFDPQRDFATDFRRFLLAPGPAHLVMVHPGGPDDTELARLDPVVATRPQEFAYLSGPHLPEDLAEARMRIIRLGDLSSS